ncbi:MAG: DUF3576 domain-containing protein [Marivivens sp.]|nr:DUF3576 domain-containing protein [Marivivens sp.]
MPITASKSGIAALFAASLALSGCSGGIGNTLSNLNPFSGGDSASATAAPRSGGTQEVAVNKYLWSAALDVLSFLPIESVDPFTGVIDFGYGTPPGGNRAYRATVYISDAALEARSLNVALATRNGPVSDATQKAVTDAILDRARQLRIADRGL